MEFDNERDRLKYGYDAGTIVEGVVSVCDNRYVLVDEDGVAFDPQAVLSTLEGKKIRLTIVSFEAIENIQNLMASVTGSS